MPIYEFRCLNCNSIFELLVLNKDETVEMKCPACEAETFERVMSATRYAMGSSGGGGLPAGTKTESRQCPSGNCTSYEIPGP